MTDVSGSSGDQELQAHGVDAQTARTFMRWQSAQRIIPWIASAVGAFGVAWQASHANAHINVELGVAFSVSVPAGLIKILWDRRQKVRLRGRVRRYERENRELLLRNARLEGRVETLERQAQRPELGT